MECDGGGSVVVVVVVVGGGCGCVSQHCLEVVLRRCC